MMDPDEFCPAYVEPPQWEQGIEIKFDLSGTTTLPPLPVEDEDEWSDWQPVWPHEGPSRPKVWVSIDPNEPPGVEFPSDWVGVARLRHVKDNRYEVVWEPKD